MTYLTSTESINIDSEMNIKTLLPNQYKGLLNDDQLTNSMKNQEKQQSSNNVLTIHHLDEEKQQPTIVESILPDVDIHVDNGSVPSLVIDVSSLPVNQPEYHSPTSPYHDEYYYDKPDVYRQTELFAGNIIPQTIHEEDDQEEKKFEEKTKERKKNSSGDTQDSASHSSSVEFSSAQIIVQQSPFQSEPMNNNSPHQNQFISETNQVTNSSQITSPIENSPNNIQSPESTNDINNNNQNNLQQHQVNSPLSSIRNEDFEPEISTLFIHEGTTTTTTTNSNNDNNNNISNFNSNVETKFVGFDKKK